MTHHYKPLLPTADPIAEGRCLVDALAGWFKNQKDAASADDVQVMETHISWVVLAGDFAYKIKKPVNFGFLNFSTLQCRKHFCEEELRLNRRFAPRIYLAVLPVTRSLWRPDQPELGGSGQVIEYAVKMRRFAQTGIFDSLISQHQLRPQLLDSLAFTLVGLYGTAQISTSQDSFGTASSVVGRVTESIQALWESTRSLAKVHDVAELISALRPLEHWLGCRSVAIRALASMRKNSGFVRECHGDLHLGNIALIDDQVTLFDCLEFDADLRWIDLMSDVAFVVMDLLVRQQPSMAWRFLNAYLEHGGDYEGLVMLRFYVMYRALVRAKVAMLRTRQLSRGSDEQTRQIQSSKTHVLLALEQTRPVKRSLTICFGLSGSGKTAISQTILEILPAIRIRSDVERKRMLGLNPLIHSNSPIDAGLYESRRIQETYRRLAELAESILNAGFSVIVDASFLRGSDRLMFADLANRLSVAFFVLDIRVDEPTLRCRVLRRLTAGTDASEANLAVLERQLADRDSLSDEEIRRALMIDNSQSRNEIELHRVCQPIVARMAAGAGDLVPHPVCHRATS